ncbi:hypothetical protein TRIUR3_01651 [Triticum urartu]|uniref:Uncharacterized protein n=1 Tax=Triticum urartu TaxID=4572 RepID=M7ZJ13_TRIUA|nr:hypothetical protein TRIUR3_01651 [Triticum urartu]
MEVETGICDLPADCLARVASLTSPGDACRPGGTRAAGPTRGARPDCADILARWSTSDERRRDGETNKGFFFRLCDSPVLLDGGKLEITSDIGIYRRGKKSFSLDRHSGAKKYMIPAKALCYGWSGYPYGGLVWSRCHPHSRFSEVAVLSYICWLDVNGILNTKNLSGIGRGYMAYLIYRVHQLHTDTAQNQDQEAEVLSSSASSNHECNHLVPQKHSRSLLWDWGWELDGASSLASVDTEEKNRSLKQRLNLMV